MTYHKCYHWRLDQQRYVTTEAQQGDEGPKGGRPELPQDLLGQLEREQALRDALLELPPRCRQLVQMLFFESSARPYQEIAASLRIATGSVGFIRGRCLERLRNRLEKAGFA